jgi:hypothetical protein
MNSSIKKYDSFGKTIILIEFIKLFVDTITISLKNRELDFEEKKEMRTNCWMMRRRR